MPRSIKELEQLVLELPPNQRLALADWIYESVDAEDAEDEDEVSAAWDEEIKSRLDEIDSGKVKMITHEEFIADLDAYIASKQQA